MDVSWDQSNLIEKRYHNKLRTETSRSNFLVSMVKRKLTPRPCNSLRTKQHQQYAATVKSPSHAEAIKHHPGAERCPQPQPTVSTTAVEWPPQAERLRTMTEHTFLNKSDTVASRWYLHPLTVSAADLQHQMQIQHCQDMGMS